MKKIVFILFLLLFALTTGIVASVMHRHNAEVPSLSFSNVQAGQEQGKKQDTLSISTESRKQAMDLLDFCNNAEEILSQGRYGRADLMAFFIKVYLGEWQLAKLPPLKGKEAGSDLIPPKGLFNFQDEHQMANLVQTMDKAMTEMQTIYNALERYVMDTSIQDDGKKGKSLASNLQKNYKRFDKARAAYLNILKKPSKQAEDLLLADNPLRRQIVAARQIFHLYRKTAQILSQDKIDREALQNTQKYLEKALIEAERPPFLGQALSEREYKKFLQYVDEFNTMLTRGLSRGFYNATKKDLNNMIENSRSAYNQFAASVNYDK